MTPPAACCDSGHAAPLAAPPGDGADTTLVLGGGFAGLAAAHALAAAGRAVVVLEAGPVAGGLSRTERFGDFLFDLGGHRFFTHDTAIADLVGGLMGDELVDVPRSSKILLRGRYFDYPLRPRNAIASLGIADSARVLADYALEHVRGSLFPRPIVSLEDWVVRRFGRRLFEIYFRVYSEKVWGLPCDRISAAWVARRIEGLSLGKAVRNAFTRAHRREVPSLIDRFLYPRRGIGRIAERFVEGLAPHGQVRLATAVTSLRHAGGRLREVCCETGGGPLRFAPAQVISTMPLTALAGCLDPAPPPEVLRAAGALGYRDLLLAAVAVDRPSVTDQTWIYLPDRAVPFGRIHEPKNWSREMAPADRTLVVAEYFCQRGDAVWEAPDEALGATTVTGLEELGFLSRREVSGVRIVRVPNAYPRFEVGYEQQAAVVRRWCAGIENLELAGRTGSFEYFNMDHAIRSGLAAAARLLAPRP
jgi:protoporphyrinogen oxidase